MRRARPILQFLALGADLRGGRAAADCLSMMHPRLLTHWGAGLALAAVAAALACPASAASSAPAGQRGAATTASRRANIPQLPRRQVGKASFYARKFAGRKMADGTPMRPQGDNAASKTLPLGTKARVTNLETGQSAAVTIRDRGPHVRGRIIDLSPSTAERIGVTRRKGVAVVEVEPIDVPPHGGAE
jgi:rare lipoprotein A